MERFWGKWCFGELLFSNSHSQAMGTRLRRYGSRVQIDWEAGCGATSIEMGIAGSGSSKVFFLVVIWAGLKSLFGYQLFFWDANGGPGCLCRELECQSRSSG